MKLPILPTTVIGSYSMPEWLERAKNDYLARRLSKRDLDDMHDAVRKAAIKDQESAGIDIVTDGDAGGSDRSISRPDMARIRRREQTAAGAKVGVTEIAFLGYPDGRLTPSIELRRDISRVIRQQRPDRVVTQSAERNYQRIFASHPDHIAAGEAALSAVYPDARNPFAHMELLESEGLEPHTVPEVYVMAMAQGDTVVDITDTVERKLAALQCHASQYDNWEELAERIRGWARVNGEQPGMPEGHSAEVFLLVATG